VLDEIARACHRWTAGYPVEIALLVPILRGVPEEPVSVAPETGRRCVFLHRGYCG